MRECHGLRLFLQGSAVGIAVSLWFGDISVAAPLPSSRRERGGGPQASASVFR